MAIFSTVPLWVVVKLAENGCLLSYLQKRGKAGVEYENVKPEAIPLTERERMGFALDVSKGMDHLSKMKVIDK